VPGLDDRGGQRVTDVEEDNDPIVHTNLPRDVRIF
jgi:hypothetical protein